MTRSRAAIFLLAFGSSAISSCGDDVRPDVGDTPPPPLATGTTTASTGSTGPVAEPTVCGMVSGGGTDTGADGGTTGSDSGSGGSTTDTGGGGGTTEGDPGSGGSGPGSDPAAGCFCAGEYVVGGSRPGTFWCQPECIPSGAVGQWCWDDASCCEGPCRPDGLCGEAPTTEGSTSSATEGTSGSSSDTMGESSDSGTTGEGSGTTGEGSGTTGGSSGTDDPSTGGSGSSTG